MPFSRSLGPQLWLDDSRYISLLGSMLECHCVEESIMSPIAESDLAAHGSGLKQDPKVPAKVAPVSGCPSAMLSGAQRWKHLSKGTLKSQGHR